jgi:hypothetical protein
LLKLAVEGLPVGADAGIADKAFFGVSFDHIYANHNPLIRLAQAKCTKVLNYERAARLLWPMPIEA